MPSGRATEMSLGPKLDSWTCFLRRRSPSLYRPLLYRSLAVVSNTSHYENEVVVAPDVSLLMVCLLPRFLSAPFATANRAPRAVP